MRTCAVNERFADKLAEVAPADAIVWVHDYHLQLVPSMLRDGAADVASASSSTSPSRPIELFTRLPWRTRSSQGMLGCDLIGFQTLERCQQLHDRQPASSHASGDDDDVVITTVSAAKSATFPISIDVEELEELAAGRATRRRVLAQSAPGSANRR